MVDIHADRQQTKSLLQRSSLYLTAVLLGISLVIFDRLDGLLYMADIDDVLRALQVRTLLETGNWFDRTLEVIQMPEAYVSPWSRLVDAPYAIVAWLLGSILAQNQALHIAFQVWPVAMLTAYCVTIVEVQKRLLPDGSALNASTLIASIVVMLFPIWEFSPGRIDHHNVQLLLSMFVFLGLLQWTGKGALLTAVGAVLSVAVGLELLPFVALVLCLVTLSWILKREGSIKFLQNLGFGIFVMVPLTGLLLLGPQAMTETSCDAFSAPYIIALAGFGLIAGIAPIVLEQQSTLKRLIILGVVATIFIGVLAAAFPLCLQGPYHMIDPLSRELWLNQIWQERSVLALFEDSNFTPVYMIGLLSLIALAAFPMVVKQWKNGKTGVAIVFAAAAFCLILTYLQTRNIRFPAAFIPLFIPLVFLMFNERFSSGMRFIGVASAFLAIVGATLYFTIPSASKQLSALDYFLFYDCKEPDLTGLAALPKGRIMAPASLGLFMADRLPSGMTIAAVSFHRSSPGMRRSLETFITADPKARKLALEPFDYVAVCQIDLPDTVTENNLYTTLTRGGVWPGLEPIVLQGQPAIRLFRIDHANLQ